MVACSKGAPSRQQPAPDSSTTATPSAEDEWAALEARPLHLPSLEAGAACPVSDQTALGVSEVTGQGPIFAVGGPRWLRGKEEGGWYFVKVLWLSRIEYNDPALIRGHRLDGPEEIRFNDGARPDPELRFPAGSTGAWGAGYPDTRQLPSYSRFEAPGCYAWQVDGLDFSYTIVFEVAS
jgi:hypothetical protein